MNESSGNQLSVEDVKTVIRQAQGGDPVALVLQILSSLGPSISVSGDVLREAFKECAIAVDEPLSSVLAGITQVLKEQNTLTITRPTQTEFSVSGTRLRIQPELAFEVGTLNGRPVITSITGLSAHKIFWIGIQSLEWLKADDQNILRVGTSAGTRDIPLP